jgi:2-hydroxychromene-2-carboxylate isomerase
MTGRVDFFFDYGSPYSYVANAMLPDLARRTGAEVAYRPMLLGAVFKATGNQSPAFEPCEPKRRYAAATLMRWTRRLGLPFRMNPSFPIDTLVLMRGAVASQRLGVFDAYHAAIYPAMWSQGKNLGQEPVVREVLGEAGIDADRLLALAADDDVKRALRANTDEALSRGAFGAPTFVVGDELFFGADHMDFVEEVLGAGGASR